MFNLTKMRFAKYRRRLSNKLHQLHLGCSTENANQYVHLCQSISLEQTQWSTDFDSELAMIQNTMGKTDK